MFAAPPRIEAEVFAQVPDHLKRDAALSEWIEKQPGSPCTHSLLEGPSFDRDGTFYCVDVAHGRIFTVAPDGRFDVVADYDGWPNGIAIHRDGRLFVADYKHGIMCLDPKSGHVTPVLER